MAPESVPGDLETQLAAERARIACQLSETLIHRMFGMSLALHGAMQRVDDVDARASLSVVLTDLDKAIAEIRHIVFTETIHDRVQTRP